LEQNDQPDPVDQPAWNPPAHTGDTLVDFGRRLEINDWLRGGMTREEVAERLRPRVERLVEGVLPSHGAPRDRAALERALS
jgi:hypothetical protein